MHSCAASLREGLTPRCAELALYHPSAVFNCSHLRRLAHQPDEYYADLSRARAGTGGSSAWRKQLQPMLFAVGFGDTGTRSLNGALEALQVGSVHNAPKELIEAVATGDFGKLYHQGRRRVEAYTDDPVGGLWSILTGGFENYRVILTTRAAYHRNSGAERLCMTSKTGTRVWHRDKERFSICIQYGRGCAEDMAENVQLEHEHAATVVAAVPPSRLLIMNLSDPNSWRFERLAQFLNRTACVGGRMPPAGGTACPNPSARERNEARLSQFG